MDSIITLSDNVKCLGIEKYVRIIKRIAETDGLEIANQVNHRALELKKVPLEWFFKAAEELAQNILNR